MKKIVITGGLGFIGVHAVMKFLDEGWAVVVVDNQSRKGTVENLHYLNLLSKDVYFEKVDIRDFEALQAIFIKHKSIQAVVHLAGQVAVTTSVKNPREDFEINAMGTFNVLECVRQITPEAVVVFASTNKVYGNLPDVRMIEGVSQYSIPDFPAGITEQVGLDFHSPYGCSKGCADQYVRDYSRIYGLKTIVCRQSCIYGTRQFGIEDQGWVAWFSIAAVLGLQITVYGDGKQVRDILFVEDLVDLYARFVQNPGLGTGQVFNVGGGPKFSISLLELLQILESALGRKIPFTFADWRPGDQKVYISNINHVSRTTGWVPTTSAVNGVKRLIEWTRSNEMQIRKVLGYL
jgi:CDP-paratose 2-epimerase